MSRSLSIAIALAAAAALVVATALSLAIPGANGGDGAERVEEVLALALDGARWRAEAQLGNLRSNAFLAASLEESDEEGVQTTLASSCLDGGCTIFDEDGDVVAASASSPGPGARDAASTKASAPRSARLASELRLAAESGIIWSSHPDEPAQAQALIRLGGDASPLGYAQVSLRLDAVIAQVAAVTRQSVLIGSSETPSATAVAEPASLKPRAITEGPLPLGARRLTLPRELPAAFTALQFHAIPSPRPAGLPVFVALLAAALAGVVPLAAHARRRERLQRESLENLREALTSLGESDSLTPLDAAAWSPAERPLIFAANALIVRAVSATYNAESTRHSLEQRIERISELLQIEDGAFAGFVDKVAAASAACQALVEGRSTAVPAAVHEQLRATLRALHTVKSSARLLGLSQVHAAARDAEDEAARFLRSDAPSAEGIEALSSQLSRVEQETLAYRSIRTRVLGETRDGRAEALWAQLSWLKSCLTRTFAALRAGILEPTLLFQLYDEYCRAIASMGKEDLTAYVRRYDAMLRDLASRSGKKLAPLTLTGNGRFFDHEVMRKLDDVLLHALRNAIDHGVEAPTRRKAVGKPEIATVAIESQIIDRIATIKVLDDGRGLDRSELTSQLEKQGLGIKTELEALSDTELYDKLFAAGLTTRSEAGELSGRGVGLETLREIVRGLGGEARIAPRVGAGTEIVIHFPIDEYAASERLTVVSLEAELREVVAKMQPALRAADTHVEVAVCQDDALVTVDRIVLRTGVERLILAMAEGRAKPLVLDAAVALESRSSNGLGTYKLQLAPRADQNPTPLDDSAAELLLEGGMALLPSPSGCGVEVLVPSGITPLVAPWHVVVVTSGSAADAAASAFRAAAAHAFRSLRLELVAAVPPPSTERRIIIVVLDEQELAQQARESAADVAIVVCREIGAVAWERLHHGGFDPILVEGSVDAACAREALEMAMLLAARRAIEGLSPLPTQAA